MAWEYTKEIVLLTIFSVASRMMIGSFMLDASRKQPITYMDALGHYGLIFFLNPSWESFLGYPEST